MEYHLREAESSAIPAELPAFLKTPKKPNMQQSSHVPSSVVQAENQWEKAGKNLLLPLFVETFEVKQWLHLYSHCPSDVKQVIILVLQPM